MTTGQARPERLPWIRRRGDRATSFSIDYNLDLANKVIGGMVDSDDIAIALHLMGWKIVPLHKDAPPWPMFSSHLLNPPWAKIEPRCWRGRRRAAT